jgi:hypothetical protein
MRRVAIAIISGVLMVAIGGCGSSTGPTESPGLADYWIEGHYLFELSPLTGRDFVWPAAVVHVLTGGPDGEPVSGLIVTCNGQSLPFTDSSYLLENLLVPPGADVTFKVSDGSDSLSLTLVVPSSPTELSLAEGTWDFFDPDGSHTLSWENPAVVGDSVFVEVAGHGMHPIDVHGYSVRLPASANEVTLSNQDLADFATVTEVQCSVSQGVHGVFPEHPGGSDMWARAATMRRWPQRRTSLAAACLPN